MSCVEVKLDRGVEGALEVDDLAYEMELCFLLCERERRLVRLPRLPTPSVDVDDRRPLREAVGDSAAAVADTSSLPSSGSSCMVGDARDAVSDFAGE